MIVKCPKCSTKYDIPRESIPPEGKQAKCAACQNVFSIKLKNKQIPEQEKPQLGVTEGLTSEVQSLPHEESSVKTPTATDVSNFTDKANISHQDGTDNSRNTENSNGIINGLSNLELDEVLANAGFELNGNVGSSTITKTEANNGIEHIDDLPFEKEPVAEHEPVIEPPKPVLASQVPQDDIDALFGGATPPAPVPAEGIKPAPAPKPSVPEPADSISQNDIDALFGGTSTPAPAPAPVEAKKPAPAPKPSAPEPAGSVSQDDIDALFGGTSTPAPAPAPVEAKKPAPAPKPSVPEPAGSVSQDDIDALFGGTSTPAPVQAKQTEPATAANTGLKLEADSGTKSDMKATEFISQDDIDSLFNSTDQNLDRSEPDNLLTAAVSQDDIDSLLNQVKTDEQLVAAESSIVKPAEPQAVAKPEDTGGILSQSDLDALLAEAGGDTVKTPPPDPTATAVAEPPSGELISQNDLDTLLAAPPAAKADETTVMPAPEPEEKPLSEPVSDADFAALEDKLFGGETFTKSVSEEFGLNESPPDSSDNLPTEEYPPLEVTAAMRAAPPPMEEGASDSGFSDEEMEELGLSGKKSGGSSATIGKILESIKSVLAKIPGLSIFISTKKPDSSESEEAVSSRTDLDEIPEEGVSEGPPPEDEITDAELDALLSGAAKAGPEPEKKSGKLRKFAKPVGIGLAIAVLGIASFFAVKTFRPVETKTETNLAKAKPEPEKPKQEEKAAEPAHPAGETTAKANQEESPPAPQDEAATKPATSAHEEHPAAPDSTHPQSAPVVSAETQEPSPAPEPRQTPPAMAEKPSLAALKAASKLSIVEFGTILPVEYNADSTKILSTKVKLYFEGETMAKKVKANMFFYETAVENLIDNFFANTFYEETAFASDKLQEMLLAELNKTILHDQLIKLEFENFKVN